MLISADLSSNIYTRQAIMCGRFTQTHTAADLAAAFQVDSVPPQTPRYNIAPSQQLAAVLQTSDHPDRQLRSLRWGLLPRWAKDPSLGHKLINARSETVAEKPSFRSAFKHRRCLIPADGFYEWQRLNGKKQPYYFCLTDRQPFGFAGLWEEWQSPEGQPVQTCTILTTVANAVLATVHDRMPVILVPDTYDTWLDPDNEDVVELQTYLQPYPAEDMHSYPVSSWVNNPSHEAAACIEPMS